MFWPCFLLEDKLIWRCTNFEVFKFEAERQVDKNVKIMRPDKDSEFCGICDETGRDTCPFAKFLK